MNVDLYNNILASRAVSPAAATTNNTAWTSQIIDTANYDSMIFLINIGELADADATFTVLLEEGDDSGLSDNSSVADADMLGTEAAAGFTFADDNTVAKIGYLGAKRYVRLTITPAANTGNAYCSVIAVQGAARKAPVS